MSTDSPRLMVQVRLSEGTVCMYIYIHRHPAQFGKSVRFENTIRSIWIVITGKVDTLKSADISLRLYSLYPLKKTDSFSTTRHNETSLLGAGTLCSFI